MAPKRWSPETQAFKPGASRLTRQTPEEERADQRIALGAEYLHLTSKWSVEKLEAFTNDTATGLNGVRFHQLPEDRRDERTITRGDAVERAMVYQFP